MRRRKHWIEENVARMHAEHARILAACPELRPIVAGEAAEAVERSEEGRREAEATGGDV